MVRKNVIDIASKVIAQNKNVLKYLALSEELEKQLGNEATKRILGEVVESGLTRFPAKEISL